MKHLRNYGFFLGFVLLSLITTGQNLRKHLNEAFDDKEFTRYSVYYNSMITGNVTAGEATIEVKTSKQNVFDREVWQIVGEGKSKGAFNWFFKVRDRFESFVDKEAYIPYVFVRRTKEGSYEKDDDVVFYHEDGFAVSRTAKTTIPPNVQDFVSALFYMRTLSISNFDADSNYFIDFLLNDSVYVSKVKFEGIENVKIGLGTFRCLKIAPMMATGEVFSDAYPVIVWVTDDKNHLPILAEAKVVVGSVKMELVEFKHLKNSIEAKLD
ncbi:MAG: DUF3108 domain-containing protein [Bacteroidales bacterium]|nr:DUF3108 domain-containing protein [Bacteroidales bacterium]